MARTTHVRRTDAPVVILVVDVRSHERRSWRPSPIGRPRLGLRAEMHLRREPDDVRSGSGPARAGAPSVGRPGDARRQWRISASAVRCACSAFFDLTLRAGRIALAARQGSPAARRGTLALGPWALALSPWPLPLGVDARSHERRSRRPSPIGRPRLGLRAEKCTSGESLTMSAPARVLRGPVRHQLGVQVTRGGSGESAPPRSGAPAAHFST
jgi:hypothetical protein